MIKPLNTLGDTLIEVLIATALVSSILGAAYTTSNRSLRATRQAEERVQALKYTESQVEKLRIAASASTADCDTKDIFCAAKADFCLNYAGDRVDFAVAPPPSSPNDGFSEYLPDCQSNTGGTKYYVSIHRVTPGAPDPSSNFTVHARWPSFGSTINDEVTLRYRLNK